MQNNQNQQNFNSYNSSSNISTNNNYLNYHNVNNNVNRHYNNGINNQNFYPKNNIYNGASNFNNTNINQNWYGGNNYTNNNLNNPNYSNQHYENKINYTNEKVDHSIDEIELNKINAKYKFFNDQDILAKEFLQATFDKKYFSRMINKLNIKESLLKEEEPDILRIEDLEQINEKQIFKSFIEEKINKRIISLLNSTVGLNAQKDKFDINKRMISSTINEDDKMHDDIQIQIPLEKNNFQSIQTNEVSDNTKEKKMELENNENIEKKKFFKELDLDEFKIFFKKETNFDYKQYLESVYFHSYFKKSYEKKNTNLEPNYLLYYIANISKNKKLEKFIKENISSDKLELEKNKFLELINECEKNEYSENELKKEKNKLMAVYDHKNINIINQINNYEISDDMIKYNIFNLPYYISQEEIPKEIKEIEMNAKKIKSDIYNCENSLTKIFSERLEISKKICKLVSKVKNNQDIKNSLIKYKITDEKRIN